MYKLQIIYYHYWFDLHFIVIIAKPCIPTKVVDSTLRLALWYGDALLIVRTILFYSKSTLYTYMPMHVYILMAYVTVF